MNDTETRAHHPYSPSSLQSIEVCPCFKSRESHHIRSVIGTIAHKVTETREDDMRLSDEDAAAAAECIDFYDGRVKLAQEARDRAVKLHIEDDIADVIELTESYLPIDDIKFPDGVEATTAGFVDRVIVTHDRTYAELFDWKFGMWSVEKAENNLQGIAYTLGLFKKYPTLKSARFFFKQPHTNEISHSYFTREMIAEQYLRITAVVARARKARELMAKDDFSMANPTVPNCLFCAHIADCTKVLDIALKVGKKFNPLMIPADITPTMIHNARDTKWGMDLCAVLAVWAPAYRGRLTDRVLNRTADCPSGFIIATGSRRSIKNVDKLRDVAQEYLTKEEYDALLSKEPPFGTLEEAVQAKAARGQKTSVLREFQQKIIDNGAVEKSEPFAYLKAVTKKSDDVEVEPTKTENQQPKSNERIIRS